MPLPSPPPKIHASSSYSSRSTTTPEQHSGGLSSIYPTSPDESKTKGLAFLKARLLLAEGHQERRPASLGRGTCRQSQALPLGSISFSRGPRSGRTPCCGSWSGSDSTGRPTTKIPSRANRRAVAPVLSRRRGLPTSQRPEHLEAQ